MREGGKALHWIDKYGQEMLAVLTASAAESKTMALAHEAV
jgi:hypothetical protein